MLELDPASLADAAGADLISGQRTGPGPERAAIDSRAVGDGDLFFGLRGDHADGGEFAQAALDAGAWGVVVDPAHAASLEPRQARVLAAENPLAALQALAHSRRSSLGASVLGVTGSTGKTSAKDIAKAIFPGRVHASPANFNTEIGLPMTILEASADTELLVLEMAMRGPGQIRELCEIAEPDIVIITNVGPVHLELLGSLEAVAAAKAEALDGLGEGYAVVPSQAGALEPHLTGEVKLLRFGQGGDVFARSAAVKGGVTRATIVTPEGEHDFEFPFDEAHNLLNALAAVGAGVALDVPLKEMARLAPGIVFSELRGEVVELPGDAILINDSYNANPVSMRAALDHLGSVEVSGKRIAVLGDMLELGPESASYHRGVGEHAKAAGADYVIAVGGLAASYGADVEVPDAEAAAEALRSVVGPGDAVLVKGSRGIGLDRVAELLGEKR